MQKLVYQLKQQFAPAQKPSTCFFQVFAAGRLYCSIAHAARRIGARLIGYYKSEYFPFPEAYTAKVDKRKEIRNRYFID